MRPYDHRTDDLEERDARVLERQDKLDRQADHAPAIGPNVIPLAGRRPAIDVDELERERAAAGPRPIRSSEDLIAELHGDAVTRDPSALAPVTRLVVAGDVVAELERQAVQYGRDLLVMALIAGVGTCALFALAVMFARGR